MWANLSALDVAPVVLSLKLAAVTTVILLVTGVPLAWWLARGRGWGRHALGAVVTLPLVLPPSVLGFYVLVALGPQGPLGRLLALFGIPTLNFTFSGLVVGSVIYSLPFMVQPVKTAFEAIGRAPLEAAATLRAGPIDCFFHVVLPLAKPGLLTGVLMTFAHTVGEFGVVLMIGGNIPGQTQVVSTEIYTYVEGMEYGKAHCLAGAMLVFSFVVLAAANVFERRTRAGS